MSVEARLWQALCEVEDPEIPVSVVGMGLIVSVAYRPAERAADIELTFTSMNSMAGQPIAVKVSSRSTARSSGR